MTYWKRFAASVIDFANRFRTDQFLRTEVSIIGLQVGFGLVLLRIVWLGFELIQKTPLNVFIVVFLVTTLTGVFGYILARLALIPSKTTLNSQKRFISNVAHELRTPISIIKTNTEVALFDSTLHKDMRAMLNSNVEELDRISHIIDNLLSLSAFVRPEKIEFSNVSLCVVVDSVAEDISPLVKRKEQMLLIQKASYGMVWGNKVALEQIVMNLLKNAINYTNDGGKILIVVEPDHNGSTVLMIKDSGIGIAKKDLFRVFEPFYRIDESRSRKRGSSGLGLAIVSELIKLHHGKISIQSKLGSGTTIRVLLPCGKNELPVEKKKTNLHPSADHGEISVDFSS